MKTSPTTPRTSRRTTTAALKAPTTEKKARAPRATTSRRKAAPAAVQSAEPEASPAMPTIEDLNRRAYEIYLGRNGQGDALSDWLQAERELTTR